MNVTVDEEDNLPVHDVVLMAVVDARENLLHKDSTIPFGEFAALQNFIEELTSLADPTIQIRHWLPHPGSRARLTRSRGNNASHPQRTRTS